MVVAVRTERRRSFFIRFKAAGEGRQSIKERRTKDIPPPPEGGNKQKKANQNQSFQDGEASGKGLEQEDGFFFIEGSEIVI